MGIVHRPNDVVDPDAKDVPDVKPTHHHHSHHHNGDASGEHHHHHHLGEEQQIGKQILIKLFYEGCPKINAQ